MHTFLNRGGLNPQTPLWLRHWFMVNEVEYFLQHLDILEFTLLFFNFIVFFHTFNL